MSRKILLRMRTRQNDIVLEGIQELGRLLGSAPTMVIQTTSAEQQHGPRSLGPRLLSNQGYYHFLLCGASVLVLGLCTTSFDDIAHVVEHEDREGRHTLPLFLVKRAVKRLPRLGELVQIG